MGAILTLASSVQAQVSGEGAPALLSSAGHGILLFGKPELLLLRGNVEELGDSGAEVSGVRLEVPVCQSASWRMQLPWFSGQS